jgi:hypothetical protein
VSGALQAVSVAANSHLDVDLPLVRLCGAVTENGGVMPAAPEERGSLTFRVSAQGGDAVTVPLSPTGAASYAAALLGGSYDVEFTFGNSLCASGGSGLPCSGGELLGGQDLTESGVLNLDLKTVHVHGQVSQGGLPMLARDLSGGKLLFHSADWSAEATLATTGSAGYDVTLQAGTYQVEWQAPQPCNDPLTPCWSDTFASGVALSADTALDLDLPQSVEVHGLVTMAGGLLPEGNDFWSPGVLTFTSPQGSAYTRLTQPYAGYSISLAPGRYTVQYVAGMGCGADAPGYPYRIWTLSSCPEK